MFEKLLKLLRRERKSVIENLTVNSIRISNAKNCQVLLIDAYVVPYDFRVKAMRLWVMEDEGGGSV